jgi:hypothetical protein
MNRTSVRFLPLEDPRPAPTRPRRTQRKPVAKAAARKKAATTRMATFPTAPPRGPIIILGDIGRDLALLNGDLKRLPTSAAEYDARIELMLGAARRLEADLAQLLVHYREQEG